MKSETCTRIVYMVSGEKANERTPERLFSQQVSLAERFSPLTTLYSAFCCLTSPKVQIIVAPKGSKNTQYRLHGERDDGTISRCLSALFSPPQSSWSSSCEKSCSEGEDGEDVQRKHTQRDWLDRQMHTQSVRMGCM